ncbi:unnamed protein product [Allacma fusca]|uniref:CRAL/TRIO N-terminal domain-containing protein n=1 Tax=Allacma fusca TaxID=39272 RepID=A0A8J2NLC9_9HEXA|nr:unnamed protein product [Allacma fusca]
MDPNSVTAQEKIALKKFRANISDVLETLSEYDAHDLNLIRWIRARDFNLADAEKMLRKSLAWRLENNIEKLRVVEYSDFLLSKLVFTPCGHDKEGALSNTLLNIF